MTLLRRFAAVCGRFLVTASKLPQGKRNAVCGHLWPKAERECSAQENHLQRAPTEAQRSGFGGKRTSDRVTELCRLRRSEGYVVREDDGQHRVCLVCGNAAAQLPHDFRAEARTHFIYDLEETT